MNKSLHCALLGSPDSFSVDDVLRWQQQCVRETFENFVPHALDSEAARVLKLNESLKPRVDNNGVPMFPELRVLPGLDLDAFEKIGFGEIAGDCLAPFMIEGDCIFVLPSTTFVSGDIACVHCPPNKYLPCDSFPIKLVFSSDDQYVLLSANDPPIRWRPELKVIGILVAHAHYELPRERAPIAQQLLADSKDKAIEDDFGWSESNCRKTLCSLY